MTQESLTSGGLANVEFVSDSKAEDEERQDKDKLANLIPAGCLDCSAAWLRARLGRAERVKACTGRTEETIGQYTVGHCHLPAAKPSG